MSIGSVCVWVAKQLVVCGSTRILCIIIFLWGVFWCLLSLVGSFCVFWGL